MTRDEDGKPLMSLEKMKEGMFQSIRDNGTVELIRAQLRRQFIEKLQQHRRNDDHDEENNAGRANKDAISSTPGEKLVHGLVAEYLATKGLENTLAVFVPEIGGSRNQVDSATILEILHVSSDIQAKLNLERASTGHSLLFILVRELVRRFQLATMDSGTQTAMDCFDHRIVLENELRRVENSYLAERAAQKLDPQKSLESRLVQYQREYDEICEKRLQEELERYKSTEVALVRAEERKRFNREVDTLRASLLQENRNKQERLQEHERELELAFVARRTELETSLFETRQSLFKDMERLRVKEAELQVKIESDFRHFASETQRFQLWEESVRTQEANLEGIVAQATREKERAWNIERQQALADIQSKRDELADRERTLTTEIGTLKTLRTQAVNLQQEVAALEAALSKSGDELRIAQSSALQLDKDRQRLESRVVELETQLAEQKKKMVDIDTTNARLFAEKNLVNDELSRYKQKNADIKDQMKLITVEVKTLQQQILDMKLNEANAIVSERKRFMKVIDEERERSQWKENELLLKLREAQSRLAESEALAEKYQSQYEDEKVHVESLRHDVSSLNSLLTQAQATINAKHGAPRETLSFRAHRNESYDTGGGTERTFMMKMMEMMANLQHERGKNTEYVRVESDIPVSQRRAPQPAASSTPLVHDEEQEENKRLKEEQECIERELTEQRENEKKRQREEELRKQTLDDEEARLQEELARQRAAVQEAAELQQQLADQRFIDEKRRLEEEQAFRERRLAEEQMFNEEMEAKRRQQQLEDELAAKQRHEREAEEGRLRQERNAQEEEKRIRMEHEKAEALQAALHKKEGDRQREEELRIVEEERKRKEAEEAEQAEFEAVADASRQESSIEDDDADSNHSEEKIDTVVHDEVAPIGNIEGGTTSDIHSDNEQAAEESVSSAGSHDSAQSDDTASDIQTITEDAPAKTPEEEEQERQRAAEEAKKNEDENAIDVYRQRVLARKAAEKQRQQELEAENERKAKEEEERQRTRFLDASESDEELELSGGSFAESSVASNSDSF